MAFDLSRRMFLRAAAVAAPMLAVPTAATLASGYTEENAALLAMEPDLDAAEAEMVAASAARTEALRIGNDLWPSAPEIITYKISHYSWDGMERMITGAALEGAPGVWSASSIEAEMIRLMRRRKITPGLLKEREHTRRRLEAAQAYESACEHARTASRFPEAHEREQVAAKALAEIVGRIQNEPSHTMAGVRLKAKALRAWAHAPHWERMLNAEGRDKWAPNFARTLLETLEV